MASNQTARGINLTVSVGLTPHGLSHFAVGIVCFQFLAFVMMLQALADGNRDLDDASCKMDFQRDERQTLLAGHFGKLLNFSTVQQ